MPAMEPRMLGRASRVSILLWILAAPSHSIASPGTPPAGYTLVRVSDAVPAASLTAISQLAFRPGDPTHLFAARPSAGVVTRYDYSTPDGSLSNPLDVASGLPYPVGLAFHGADLFVSLNPTAEGRLARLRDLDSDGIYEERVDFVRAIPRDVHTVNQIRIAGSSLFVSIGTKSSGGSPSCERIYTGTLARIADLNLSDFGGANNLADSASFVDPAPVDGFLRRYAFGLRNAFGVRVDATGRVWSSDNGTSECHTCRPCNNFSIDTPDLFYRGLKAGDKGIFPPAGYPGGSGSTISPFAQRPVHAAVTGFEFIPSGTDAGKILLAEYGPDDTTFAVGRDVIAIDSTSGTVTPFIAGFDRPTDIAIDPLDRMLIADFHAAAIYLLTPPGVASVDGVGMVLGSGVRVLAISPLPFHGSVSIRYRVSSPDPVGLVITDLAGRKLATLTTGPRSAGEHAIVWDGRDRHGRQIPPGVYSFVLATSSGSVAGILVRTR
jgi:glucose/arabinose dehydrogenase